MNYSLMRGINLSETGARYEIRTALFATLDELANSMPVRAGGWEFDLLG